MDAKAMQSVWERLVSGRPLDDLALPTTPEGRTDLRGLEAPKAVVGAKVPSPSAEVRRLDSVAKVAGARWTKLDLSNAQLESVRLFGDTMEDCRFDSAKLRGAIFAGCDVTDCTFRGTDLRSAGFGGKHGGKVNVFRRVDFTKADLRGATFDVGEFLECRFSDTKLRKVEFMGSVFEDCIFEGTLEETAFSREGLRGPGARPNEMKGCDFRRAKLRSVTFQGMNLEDVKWPNDDEHIVIDDFVATLDRVIPALDARPELSSRQLGAYLGVYRHWAGPKQRIGVLHRAELVRMVGAAAVAELERELTGGARH